MLRTDLRPGYGDAQAAYRLHTGSACCWVDRLSMPAVGLFPFSSTVDRQPATELLWQTARREASFKEHLQEAGLPASCLTQRPVLQAPLQAC